MTIHVLTLRIVSNISVYRDWLLLLCVILYSGRYWPIRVRGPRTVCPPHLVTFTLHAVTLDTLQRTCQCAAECSHCAVSRHQYVTSFDERVTL